MTCIQRDARRQCKILLFYVGDLKQPVDCEDDFES